MKNQVLCYTTHMQTLITYFTQSSYTNYATLVKPTWAPPSWIFGPVWSVLYLMIFVSFGTVFLRTFTGTVATRLPFMVALPFIINIIANLLFTPIQFGLQNLPLASIDILIVLGTLVWAMIAVYPHMRWVTYIQIPYLLWVSFATVLQLTITFMNR